MIKTKMYRYLGRNGILTTKILLDDIKHIPMVELRAAPGHILTNGMITLYVICVEESEVDQWREIADKKD